MTFFSHSRRTKILLKQWGAGTGGAIGIAAGASAVMAPVALPALTAVALLGFVVAAYGAIVPEDVWRVKRLVIRNASVEDIERLQVRLSEFTPNAVPLAERLRVWKKCPSCFRIIEDLREGGRLRKELDIVAIYPLTEQAAIAVEAGKMRGADVRVNHIARSFRNAAGVYISFAEGSTRRTRGFVLKEVESSIAAVKRRPILIATIPTTADALRVVTKRGFNGLGGGAPATDEVCILRLAT